jgi:cysteine-rich repeat protein
MPAANCTECKKPLPEGAKTCPSCGEEVDPLIGQSLLGGQYIVKRRIARGGFGVVYEAGQPSVGGRAAIKVLRGHLSRKTDIAARFQREAIVARKLSHPSAVKVYNLWKSEDGAFWIAMEFLEGETIEARLNRKLFSPEEMVGVLGIVCEVLQEAHQKGIVHRDLNTRNIMLMPTDSGLLPKVIDFGIADVSDASALLDSGMIMGTPSFMAPEQYRGLKFADERSDVYSLGMIAYRMLSGKFPFNVSGNDALTWMFQHTSEPPIPLSTVYSKALPQGIEAAILKALEKSPEKRFQSTLAFKRDLDAAILNRPTEAPLVASVVKGPRRVEEILSQSEDENEDDYVGTTLNGRYLLLKKIGEGTLGTVYQANELSNGQKVVVKIWYRLGPLSESTTITTGPLPLSQIKHPAFVKLLAIGETEEGFLWVAEEYMERAFERSLAALMGKKRAFSVAETVPFLCQLCEAFEAAHKANIWYHSLSPKKILTQDTKELSLDKILDVEVSGLLASTELIRSRMIQGEPAYTAPEQFKGSQVDQRGDIYSLGILAYQLISGKLPFDIESDDIWTWMRAHCNEEPKPLSQVADCGKEIAQVIAQAIEKEPSKRFASMMGFQTALQDALQGLPPTPISAPVAIEDTRQLGKDPSKKLPIETREVIVSPILKVGTVEAVIEGAAKKRETPSQLAPTPDIEPPKQASRKITPPIEEEPLPPPQKTTPNLWVILLLVGVVLGGLGFFLLGSSKECGNGKLDKKEVCDDGNDVSGDGCREDCQKIERCGDSIIDANEACDDGNSKNGDGCRIDCKGREVCRDGLLDLISGEECDDGNQIETDECSNDCHVRHCGNGKLEPPEECDGGADCGPDCLKNPLPTCGNSVLDPGEECDDGNKENNDACLRSCKKAKCGDIFIREGAEACDDGNQNNNDACLSNCKVAKCGDNFVFKGVEECDDDNKNNNDACLDNCQKASCGDGVLQTGVEACDDKNQSNDDNCVNGCQLATCGDGFTQAGVEECDDGNDVNDACLNSCKKNQCGDGFLLNGSEECDDGNQSNNDACVGSCKKASCGDGFTQAGVEECDDNNANSNDACVAGCKKNQCGDGFLLQGVEECDDGNQNNSDNCPLSCKPATCGDGFVQESTEQCDDGNNSNEDGCVQGCKAATCGDGFVNPQTEQCDDKNDANNDDCLNTCKKARCGDGIIQDPKEECDDGNQSNKDSCHTDCKKPSCGDGIIDEDEECDTNDTCDGDATCAINCVCSL